MKKRIVKVIFFFLLLMLIGSVVENVLKTPKNIEWNTEGMKNINLLEESVTVKSAVKAEQDGQLEALADKIVDSMK